MKPADVEAMIAISPTQRLEAIETDEFWGRAETPASIRDSVQEALSRYSEFLELTHQDVRRAVRQYRKDEANWRARSYAFGQSLATLVDVLGETSEAAARLRRLIII